MSFKSLKIYLRLMGLWKNNAKHHHNPMRNTILIIFFINYFVTTLWFFAFEAQTFIEYSESLYYTMSTLLVLSWYSIYLYQVENYAEIFANLDILIEKSK